MAVDGIDLDVPAGEIVGLIGANGAGKTTVVECIQGLRRPDAGILRVLGLDPLTQAGRLRPLIGSQLPRRCPPTPAPTKNQRLRGDPNMIRHTDLRYGPDARDRLGDAVDPSVKGAHAALESFYYALNHRDADTLREVWADHPAAQLNDPLGGILRGSDAIADLYDKILTGPVRVQVTFDDVVEYLGDTHAVFAGREVGTYTGPEGTAVPLEIRTTRYFRYEQGRWRQYHHHGSIDDPAALAAYQNAVTS